ncbi:MAG: von Willebrand factor type A domain-containing protein, partial [Bradymonadia bacterium]
MRRRAFPYTRPAHLCSALLCMALAACAGTEEAPSNTPAASDAKQKPVAVTTGGDAPVEEPAPEMVAEAEEQVAPQAQPAPKTPALSRAKSEARIAGGAKRDMERARGPRVLKKRKIAGATVANGLIAAQPLEDVDEPSPDMNREAYDKITDNPFKATSVDALSTFSIDVDTASYANTRRFIDRSQMPPKDAVRIEEMVNYFSYDYADPKGEDPF